MKDPDRHSDDHSDQGPDSPCALLKTMAIAALLAAAVSACNRSLDKPSVPQPPKPQTSGPAPAEIKRAIFSTQHGDAVFYRAGEQQRGRLVIQS